MKSIQVNEVIFDLNDMDFNNEQIAKAIGVDVSVISELESDTSDIMTAADRSFRKLRDLYLRERIKGIYRASPFIGKDKVCERLDLELSEFERIRSLLIQRGDLKVEVERPEWVKDPAIKALAKHVVVERNK